ncbi:MAG: STAS-like domain-containing protein [Casimicrobiaceae bacterium]
MPIDKNAIRRRALELIAADGHRVGTRFALAAGVSRQVANGYLHALARDGLVEAEGTTRAKAYRLKNLEESERRYPSAGLQEHLVWRELVSPVVAELPQNVRDIWHYAATEMINNAIDHSGAREVLVGVRRNALYTEVLVADEGEGIFVKIQRALGLYHPREAILELAKGKLTTAPDRHTGEGIFFTSRAIDVFEIESYSLRFRRAPRDEDSIAELAADAPGTRVRMRLANDSTRTLRAVFDAFTDPEELTFDRTVVPLRLAQYEGEKLVSRSQAKRVAHGFERFKRVELDFAGISDIGQAFADELFRVYAAAHPQIRIVPINAAPAVDQMIRRVVAVESKAGATPSGGRESVNLRLDVDESALKRVCERHRIRRLSLFGSQLEGTARPDSDIDLLVEFLPEAKPTYFDLAEIEIELSALLGGRKVDLRTPAELSRYFREQVLREAREQYVAA